MLLPYTAHYLHRLGLAQHACVITDSWGLYDLAQSLDLKAHFEIREPHQDEFVSCWNYVSVHNISSFFLCPVTQPFRCDSLIPKMLELFEKESTHLDFITTITDIPDRSIFYVEENNTNKWRFINESKNRKGVLCKTRKMLDGCLYLIRTSFLGAVLKSNDTNLTFWKGNFCCIENDAPFMDIDTENDINKFLFLIRNLQAIDFYKNLILKTN
jgi:hypothetical protein